MEVTLTNGLETGFSNSQPKRTCHDFLALKSKSKVPFYICKNCCYSVSNQELEKLYLEAEPNLL